MVFLYYSIRCLPKVTSCCRLHLILAPRKIVERILGPTLKHASKFSLFSPMSCMSPDQRIERFLFSNVLRIRLSD